MEAGKKGFADQGHVLDDAAGPGYGDFARDIVLAAELGADQQDKLDQIGRGLRRTSTATGSPA